MNIEKTDRIGELLTDHLKEMVFDELSDAYLEKAGVAASQECSPISDVRASAEYRTDMVRVYTKRAVRKAVETMK